MEKTSEQQQIRIGFPYEPLHELKVTRNEVTGEIEGLPEAWQQALIKPTKQTGIRTSIHQPEQFCTAQEVAAFIGNPVIGASSVETPLTTDLSSRAVFKATQTWIRKDHMRQIEQRNLNDAPIVSNRERRGRSVSWPMRMEDIVDINEELPPPLPERNNGEIQYATLMQIQRPVARGRSFKNKVINVFGKFVT
jgi:hypothetical protein